MCNSFIVFHCCPTIQSHCVTSTYFDLYSRFSTTEAYGRITPTRHISVCCALNLWQIGMRCIIKCVKVCMALAVAFTYSAPRNLICLWALLMHKICHLVWRWGGLAFFLSRGGYCCTFSFVSLVHSASTIKNRIYLKGFPHPWPN